MPILPHINPHQFEILPPWGKVIVISGIALYVALMAAGAVEMFMRGRR